MWVGVGVVLGLVMAIIGVLLVELGKKHIEVPEHLERAAKALKFGKGLFWVGTGLTIVSSLALSLKMTTPTTTTRKSGHMMSPQRLQDLPDEMLGPIFSHLDPRSLSQMQRTHSRFYGVANEALAQKKVITSQRELDKVRSHYKLKTGLSVEGFVPSNFDGISSFTLKYQVLSDEVLLKLLNDSKITSLSLVSAALGNKQAAMIANALARNTLISLDLEGNLFKVEGARALAEALRHNSTLTTLNLRSNRIGADGALALAEALRHNSTLATLNLGWNQISADGALALAEALRHNSTLMTLTLEGNQISVDGARALAEAFAEVLRNNTTLATLNLGQNQIRDDGVRALVEALRHNSTLTTLSLEGNRIGNDGVQALAEVLRHNTTLATLDLEHNQIGDDAAHVIALALEDNDTLRSLNLSYNHIGDIGAQFLAAALIRNSTLTSLNLRRNTIGDNGAVAFMQALANNADLPISLNLINNAIGDATKKELEREKRILYKVG